jgi:hypothetical protein
MALRKALATCHTHAPSRISPGLSAGPVYTSLAVPISRARASGRQRGRGGQGGRGGHRAGAALAVARLHEGSHALRPVEGRHDPRVVGGAPLLRPLRGEPRHRLLAAMPDLVHHAAHELLRHDLHAATRARPRPWELVAEARVAPQQAHGRQCGPRHLRRALGKGGVGGSGSMRSDRASWARRVRGMRHAACGVRHMACGAPRAGAPPLRSLRHRSRRARPTHPSRAHRQSRAP